MAIKLMYITNELGVAHIAEDSGVDRIFIDLEVRGKEKRQGHIDSVKSHHCLADIDKIKNEIERAEVLVRANALYYDSKREIDEIIARGADIVMLPMWTTRDEALRFRDLVDKRAKAMLLLETIGAEKSIDSVLDEEGIDEVYIGLNDLHLQYGMKFMFELLANGKVEEILGKLKAAGKPCGFGGIASLDKGMISGKNILTEHYRLHSDMSILSRSFCDTSKVEGEDNIRDIFEKGVKEIRRYEDFLTRQQPEFFEENRKEVCRKVQEIISPQ
ncbi:MAG: aldolase [Prevotella sp.]|nr:aldolase [Prevotella sp.]